MKQGIVEDKDYRKDYEAGSGSLSIPLLGHLFPKLFHQEMNPLDRYFVIVKFVDGLYRYEVEKELYDRIEKGDKVVIGTDKFGMPGVILVDK